MTILHAMQSWAGSVACMVAGWVASVACVLLLQAAGGRDGPQRAWSVGDIVWGCSVASFVGALIESLPVPEVDNITVPLAVALTGQYMF